MSAEIDWDTYEPTAAVRKASMVLFSADTVDATCFGWVPQAREALAAAIPTECHESVPYEWADGDEGPCNSEHVVGYRLDEDQPYPVCADHMRPPMVPLRTALLGAES